MFYYEIFDERLNKPDIGEYTAYGVLIYRTAAKEKALIAKISDVTTDLERAEKLILLCNNEQVEPIHFNDVMEDVLYSGCCI